MPIRYRFDITKYTTSADGDTKATTTNMAGKSRMIIFCCGGISAFGLRPWICFCW